MSDSAATFFAKWIAKVDRENPDALPYVGKTLVGLFNALLDPVVAVLLVCCLSLFYCGCQSYFLQRQPRKRR